MSASELGAEDGAAITAIPGCTELTFSDGAVKWVVDENGKAAINLVGTSKEKAIKIKVDEDRDFKIAGNFTKDDIVLVDVNGTVQPMYALQSGERTITYEDVVAFAYKLEAGIEYHLYRNSSTAEICQFVLAAVDEFIKEGMQSVNSGNQGGSSVVNDISISSVVEFDGEEINVADIKRVSSLDGFKLEGVYSVVREIKSDDGKYEKDTGTLEVNSTGNEATFCFVKYTETKYKTREEFEEWIAYPNEDIEADEENLIIKITDKFYENKGITYNYERTEELFIGFPSDYDYASSSCRITEKSIRKSDDGSKIAVSYKKNNTNADKTVISTYQTVLVKGLEKEL